MQYLFLNGRHIRDRSLQPRFGRSLPRPADDRAASHRLSAFGHARGKVDVNVHPTKLEVTLPGRRPDVQPTAGYVADSLSLNRPDSAGSIECQGVPEPLTAESLGSTVPDFDRNHQREAVNRWADAQSTAAGQATPSFQKFPTRNSLPIGHATLTPNVAPYRQTAMDLQFPAAPARGTCRLQPLTASGAFRRSSRWYGQRLPEPARTVTATGTPALQVYDRYLITETDEGVVVIDQHALHERILYEEIREKVLGGCVEMQRLLVPEPVQLTAGE